MDQVRYDLRDIRLIELMDQIYTYYPNSEKKNC